MKQDRLSREFTIELIVGIFSLSIFIGLAYFTIILSGRFVMENRYIKEIIFDNVAGLDEGDNVVMRGMVIGKVKELKFHDKNVKVVCELKYPIVLHEGYKIRVVPSSILGGTELTIEDGPEHAEVVYEDVFVGERPYNLVDDASAVISEIKEKFIGEEGALENLKKTTASLRNIVKDIEEGKGLIGKLLKDETLYNDLLKITSDLKSISERLEKGEGTLGKLLSADDRIYRNLDEAVADLKEITENIKSGKGVIGKLLTDDELYNEIKKGINDIRAAIEEIRESTPVVTFTSVLFGTL